MRTGGFYFIFFICLFFIFFFFFFAQIPLPRVALFRRILNLTGFVFSENITKKLSGIPLLSFPLPPSLLSNSLPLPSSDRSVWMSEPVDYLDLIEIGERVKCMDIVSLSQGNFFLYKALGMSDDKV